jgi:hypothetical protein
VARIRAAHNTDTVHTRINLQKLSGGDTCTQDRGVRKLVRIALSNKILTTQCCYIKLAHLLSRTMIPVQYHPQKQLLLSRNKVKWEVEGGVLHSEP